jgi:hypothetical protein
MRLIKNYSQHNLIKKIESLNRVSKIFEVNFEKQKIQSFYTLFNKVKYKKNKNISVRHLRNSSNTKSEPEIQSLPTMMSSLTDSNRNIKNRSTNFCNLSNFTNRKNKDINNLVIHKQGYFNQENNYTSAEKNFIKSLAECSFQPNIKSNKPKSKERDVFSDLYNHSKTLKEKRNRTAIDYLRYEGGAYSFSPNRNENLNLGSFTDFQVRNEKVNIYISKYFFAKKYLVLIIIDITFFFVLI